MKTTLRILSLLLTVTTCFAEPPEGYYRYPALHGNEIIFTAEGDLWQVPITGGIAQRLTTHLGTESHASISPDGNTVAFSAEYEGPTEVYTMPVHGGLPTRLTYEGARALVAGWAADSQVLYTTEWYSTLPNWQLATINIKTREKRVLPLAQASQGVFETEGEALFFTRFAKQGSSTKRYQGGWVESLWRFKNGDPEAVPLTADFKGTSRNPMWWEGRVYFASDRDGIMNLWSIDPDGSDLKQLTRHQDHDVKTPSLHQGRIVYQHAADLRLYGIDSQTDSALKIRLASDFEQQRERWIKKPMDYLTSAHLSPDGDRLVLTARGQIFVAPAEQGRFVEIARKPDVRYRNARFMPDGKSLVALSDETSELEFWRFPANGIGPATPLTTNSTRFRFAGMPSPDSKRIAWADKDRKFWVHEIETGATTLIAESPRDTFDEFRWSPDSQWLAYVDVDVAERLARRPGREGFAIRELLPQQPAPDLPAVAAP